MLEQGPGKNWSWFHTPRQEKKRSFILSKKVSQLQQDQCFLLSIFRLCLKESRNTPFVPSSLLMLQSWVTSENPGSHTSKPPSLPQDTLCSSSSFQFPQPTANLAALQVGKSYIAVPAPKSFHFLSEDCKVPLVLVLLFLITPLFKSPSCAVSFLLPMYKEEFRSPFALSQEVRGFIPG